MTVAATTVAAAAMMAGLTAFSPGSATAGAASASEGMQAAAASASCVYKSYDGPGFWETVSRKGKGTAKYNDGYTKRYGRSLLMATGKIHDRSVGRINKARKGDRVWVNISHNKGRTWQSCGFKTAKKDGQKLTSKWYLHSGRGVKNRYMRACANTKNTSGKRVTWCADIGNKKNRNHSDNKLRYWWTDN
ncbi:hypothetical protein [Streptomyces gobiensis]|uniref:hypothetical protein n=1 Tax=Streptomyces gobiensis TaxID=2875706 RepID=UPI001E2A970B|nr:hypothetical protein [Streptomyces gobiensis]UGY93358.1 hypothetical protein test1122_17650 [Streptomyces gobiensis]